MSNITIKELLAADTISDIVDKINFNFDQILLNGGGPLGPNGPIGELGPIGPRGNTWFTVLDLYTTDSSPLWSGTPERANDINTSGFPQFKGDPNKFLPVGLGNINESSLKIGSSNKLLRGNDIYLQESDDTLNGFNSFDGDIWEYDSDSNTWLYTGVNIKGSTGQQGTSGMSQWSREVDGSNDIIYPTLNSGQNTPKILLGKNIDIADSYNELSVLTFNSDINHITLANPALHDNTNISIEAGFINMTSDGNLIIEGSNTLSQSDVKGIILRAYNNTKIISGSSTNSNNVMYEQLFSTSRHFFTGGIIVVKGNTINNVKHQLLNSDSSDTGIDFTIKPSANVNIHDISTDSSHDLVLQRSSGKVGIGHFSSSVGSKLTIDGNVSIGSSYKYITNGPNNGLIVEGNVGIGTNSPSAPLTVSKTGTATQDDFWDSFHTPSIQVGLMPNTGFNSMLALSNVAQPSNTGLSIIINSKAFMTTVESSDSFLSFINGRLNIAPNPVQNGIGRSASSPAITLGGNTFVGGSIDGIYKDQDGRIQFSTNSTERMRIDNSGISIVNSTDSGFTTIGTTTLPITNVDNTFQTWLIDFAQSAGDIFAANFDRVIYIKPTFNQNSIIENGELEVQIEIADTNGSNSFIIFYDKFSKTDGDHGNVTRFNYSFVLPAGKRARLKYKRLNGYTKANFGPASHTIFSQKLGL